MFKFIAFIFFAVAIGIGIATNLREVEPKSNCKCYYWETWADQHPVVSNKPCKFKDGYLITGNSFTQVHKYEQKCD